MKASRAIKRLQALVRAAGDLEVALYDAATARFLPVHDIQARRGPVPALRDDGFIGLTSSAIGDEADQVRYDGTPFGQAAA